MNDKQKHDAELRRLIADAVNGEDLQFASDSRIEELLDAADVQPFSDDQVSKILERRASIERTPSLPDAIAARMGMSTTQPDGMDVSTTTNSMTESDSMQTSRPRPMRRNQSRTATTAAVVVMGICMTSLGLLLTSPSSNNSSKTIQNDAERRATIVAQEIARTGIVGPPKMTPRRRTAVNAVAVAAGTRIETGAREKRRLTLADGSILYVNANTRASLVADRRVKVDSGQVFVEVVPKSDEPGAPKTNFVVETANRVVTALGTKFAVSAKDSGTDVLVTQGRVQVSGLDATLRSGQEFLHEVDAEPEIAQAPRASESLNWTRELIAAAESPLIPASEHTGGSLIAVDPNGQEMKFSMRKYHVDVHIEDGFARTTIDQTYFNHTWQRLEGTFHFPLPPDASLSRLAMYVGPTLMEGGMVERQHGRNVFEQIRYTKRDPALLEWVDGSTFKMRVFPLEARQEKRIVLSYTQRLKSAYGQTHYRFPAGHSLDVVRDWSTRIRVKNGGNLSWSSSSHDLQASHDGQDLVLEGIEESVKFDRDIVLQIEDKRKRRKNKDDIRYSKATHEGHQYLMLRLTPKLEGEVKRKKRNWVFLFEASGDRDPLVARVQIDVIKTLLNNAEHDDTFNIVTAGTRASTYRKKLVTCTKKNIKNAIAYLEETHLIGAFDFGKALDACEPLYGKNAETYLVHVGSAVPVLGEKKEDALAERIPKKVRYVGVGIGKRWSRQFMKLAANRTGGYVTQINPDEKVAWRAFELLSILNAPRLLDINVSDAAEKLRFLNFEDSLAEGEELAAITRLGSGDKLPKSVIVTGKLNGKAYRKSFAVKRVADKADYLPRSWAKLEIDRLVSEGAQKNKAVIIKLSKAMYVMSPFTSLLVLENEAMYKQFMVDRGRKDHWALYPAPKKIQVVYEPNHSSPRPETTAKKDSAPKSASDVLKTIVFRTSPKMMTYPNQVNFTPYSYTADFLQSNAVYDGRHALVPFDLGFDQNGNGQIEELRFSDVNINGILDDGFVDTNWGVIPYFDMQRPLIVSGDLPALEHRFFGINQLHLAPNGNRTADFLFGNESNRTRFSRRDRRQRILKELNGRGTWNVPAYNLHDVSGGWNYSPGAPRTNLPTELRAYPIQGEELRRYFLNGIPPSSVVFKKPQLERLAGFGTTWNLGANAEWVDGRVYQGGFGGSMSSFNIDRSLSAVTQLGSRVSDFEMAYRLQTPRFGRVNLNTLNYLNFEALGLAPQQLREDWTVHSIVSSNDGLTLSNKNGKESDNPVVLWNSVTPSKGDTPLVFVKTNDRFEEEIRAKKSELAKVETKLAPMRQKLADVSLKQVEIIRLRESEIAQQLEMLAEEAESVKLRLTMPSISVAGPGNGRINISASPELSVNYQPPQFANDRGVFGDFVSHAPGMNTLPADVMAVVEREAAADVKIKHGTVDAKARQLIDNARRSQWQSITLKGKNGEAGTTIVFDGSDKFTYERTVSEGLRERVICDGQNLLHLYPEIGIGARRTASRFYRAELQSLIPWLVAPADELARGAHVKSIGKRTVEIVPMGLSKKTDETGKPIKFAVTQLIFAKNGLLKERRLVLKPNGKILLRTVCHADGKVELVNADKKVVAEWNLNRALAAKPELKPDSSNLVILTLPYRTGTSVWESVKDKKKSRFRDWSETDALALIAADMVSGNPRRMIQVVRERFLNRGDQRLGLHVLLISRMHQWAARGMAFDNWKLPPKDSSDPLAQFIVQYHQWVRSNRNSAEFEVSGPEDGFVQRMTAGRNLYARWISGRANKDRTKIQVEVELNRALDYIKVCRSPQLGWALLNVLQRTIQHKELHLRVAEATKEFEKIPGLGFMVRHEQARSKFKGDNIEEARSMIRKLYISIAKVGVLPPIDLGIRQEFRKGKYGPKEWNRLLHEVHTRLMNEKSLRAAIILALKARQFGDTALGDELFLAVLEELPESNRPDVALIAIQHLRQTQDHDKADSLLSPMLKDKRFLPTSSLWRVAADLAEKQGKTALALARLERALDMDFRSTSEMVNLEAVRREYGQLMTRYEKLVDAAVTLETEPPADLLKRVIRAADQWRSLDDDDTNACQTAAHIIRKLGQEQLAWDYLTTPIALRPNESAPWLSLARHLTKQKQIELASQAYQSAFASEQTNAQILWDHSQMLHTNGHPSEARQLMRQVANGKWQPRFQPFKQKALKALAAQSFPSGDE